MRTCWLLWALGLLGLQPLTPGVLAQTPSEDRLKSDFLYNFALFTEWPEEVGSLLKLCIHGKEPFGSEMASLQGKTVGGRSLVLQHIGADDSLQDCQIVFISAPAISDLPHMLDELRGRPVLTVADSPGAARLGIIFNMNVTRNKVTFEVNLKAARAVRLRPSSKLLRLATEVYQ